MSGPSWRRVALAPVARRLDIELTSTRDDGTWTWRAAGARQPKGVLDGSLLPDGARVGDRLRVEVEDFIDGLTVTAVLPPRAARKEPERLELIGSGGDEPLVTTRLVPKRQRRPRGERRDRGEGRGRGDRRGSRGAERTRRDRERTRDGGRTRREPRRPAEGRPRARRLRPRHTHRNAALDELPELVRPLADEVVRGGVPGVRQTLERMNEQARAAGMPRIRTEPLVALAERLAPRLKAADWRDRAEAALAGIDEIDLRDIRSVVVAADSAARGDEARALADRLREALKQRVDAEQKAWLEELARCLREGRAVRALRLSSRPPKAGEPLPRDLADQLVELAAAALAADVAPERWLTVVDALAYSPVHARVAPSGVPERLDDEALATVRKVASRVPLVASAVGVEASAPRRRGRRPTPPPPPPPPSPASAPDTETADASAPDTETASSETTTPDQA